MGLRVHVHAWIARHIQLLMHTVLCMRCALLLLLLLLLPLQVSVVDELGVPVKFVGVGEGIDDLQPFEALAFVEALFPSEGGGGAGGGAAAAQ